MLISDQCHVDVVERRRVTGPRWPAATVMLTPREHWSQWATLLESWATLRPGRDRRATWSSDLSHHHHHPRESHHHHHQQDQDPTDSPPQHHLRVSSSSPQHCSRRRQLIRTLWLPRSLPRSSLNCPPLLITLLMSLRLWLRRRLSPWRSCQQSHQHLRLSATLSNHNQDEETIRCLILSTFLTLICLCHMLKILLWVHFIFMQRIKMFLSTFYVEHLLTNNGNLCIK